MLTEASLALNKPGASHSLRSAWTKISFFKCKFKACKLGSCAELQVVGAFLLPFTAKGAQKK